MLVGVLFGTKPTSTDQPQKALRGLGRERRPNRQDRMQDDLCGQQLLEVKRILVMLSNSLWFHCVKKLKDETHESQIDLFQMEWLNQPGILDSFKSESFFLPISSLAMNSLLVILTPMI